jgi:hypothetical protein
MLLSRHTRRREFITLFGGAGGYGLREQGECRPVVTKDDQSSPQRSDDVRQSARPSLFFLTVIGLADDAHRQQTRAGNR